MGGNALSQPSTRLNKEQFETVSDLVIFRFQEQHKNEEIRQIKSYFTKDSFGDLDVLVTTKDLDSVFKSLEATEIVRNGDVTSIGVDVEGNIFQVDFIYSPKDELDFAAKYFAFNDMGNLLGRVYHKAGFKFGHNGLVEVLRDLDNPTQVIGEVLVSRDWNFVLELMQYDHTLYTEGEKGGFQTLEDIFKFVVSTPYFNRDIFLLENRNHISRIRDRKRPVYNAFLKWSAEQEGLTEFDWTNKKDTVRLEIRDIAYFWAPGYAKESDRILHDWNINKKYRKVFNGNAVMELTKITGKDLGVVMRRIDKMFENHKELAPHLTTEMVNAIIMHTADEVYLDSLNT